MTEKGLEKRIVQMLCCHPNQPILQRVVQEQCKVDFQFIASEFPILTESGYGFLDIIGKDQKENYTSFGLAIEKAESKASLKE